MLNPFGPPLQSNAVGGLNSSPSSHIVSKITLPSMNAPRSAGVRFSACWLKANCLMVTALIDASPAAYAIGCCDSCCSRPPPT